MFEEIRAIVTSCADGYNICVLAYGQTGSGKTYTMMGPPDDPGVNVRVIRELLDVTQTRENVTYELAVRNNFQNSDTALLELRVCNTVRIA